MADAAKPPVKYEPPKELEQKAAVQKFMGRAKRTPNDQAEYFYSIKATHIVFFVSSLAMLIGFLLMFEKDYARDWKDYQSQYARVQLEMTVHELRQLEGKIKESERELGRLDVLIHQFLDKFRKADPGKPGKALEPTLFNPKALVEVPRLTADLKPGEKPLVHVVVDEEKKKLEIVEKEKIRGQHYLKGLESNFAKSDWMAIRFQYEEALHHYEHAVQHGDARKPVYEKHLKDVAADWQKVNEKVDRLKKEFDEVDKLNTFYEDFAADLENKLVPGLWDGPGRKSLGDLKKERDRIVRERDEKLLRIEKEKPSLVQAIRNAPGLDFFAPTLKVRQVILPDIKDQLNFTRIEKIDRCHTCHVGIDNPTYAVDVDLKAEKEVDRYVFKNEFLRSLVAHARNVVGADKCPICLGVPTRPPELKDLLVEHGSWSEDDAVRYTKTFMAHPRLDLYVLSSSKHPIERFGCTICHEGDGRDTDFSRAVHMPDARIEIKENKSDGSQSFKTANGGDAQIWRNRHGTPFGEERYNWNYRELWDLPMIPKQFLQASCRRCHQQEVELDGASKYIAGMMLYERAGCYACHRTDNYKILTKDHADLKDPNLRARRPGPPLTRIAAKFEDDAQGQKWMAKWILRPRDFRPTTRMPHFFGQSNTRHKVLLNAPGEKDYPPTGPTKDERRSPIEDTVVSAMVQYLWDRSEKEKDPPPPANLKGDVERGRLLVQQVGCMACHKAEVTARKDYKPDESPFLKEFGPNLAGIGSKASKTWLYHWVRNPKEHYPDSNMPNLRLSEQEAVDVVEYLMTLRAATDKWEEDPGPAPIDHELLDKLIFEQLRLKMPDFEAKRKVEEWGQEPEKKVRWFGQAMVRNYGCYSCHYLKPDTDVFNEKIKIRWEDEEGIGVELTGAQPFGSKHYDRLDFGYAMDDGVNHKGVTFKHGFDDTEIHASVHEARHTWLLAKLKNPRLFDGGKMDSKPQDELLRMPNFDFSNHEAELLATFVLSFTDHAERKLVENALKRMAPDEIARNRGDRIVRDSNCRACHRLSLDRMVVDWTRPDPKDAQKIVTSKVTIEGRPKAEKVLEGGRKLINYDWVGDNRTLQLPEVIKNTDSIQVMVQGDDAWFIDPKNGSVEVQGPDGPVKAHPIRLRYPTDGGEIIPQIAAFKTEANQKLRKLRGPLEERRDEIDDELPDVKDEAKKKKMQEELAEIKKKLEAIPPTFLTDNPQADLEVRYPPHLRTQGSKTQADWLFAFLKKPYPIRGYLAPLGPGAKTFPDINIRMPTFDFTDEEASALVRWFAVRDHLRETAAYPNPAFKDVSGSDVYPHTAFPERDAGHLEARKGLFEKIVPVIRTECARCHFWDGAEPQNVFAPDLVHVPQRLRPRWLYAWMDDPLLLYPGTPMTKFRFPPNVAEEQDGVRGMVEFLLNFHQLKPKETK